MAQTGINGRRGGGVFTRIGQEKQTAADCGFGEQDGREGFVRVNALGIRRHTAEREGTGWASSRFCGKNGLNFAGISSRSRWPR